MVRSHNYLPKTYLKHFRISNPLSKAKKTLLVYDKQDDCFKYINPINFGVKKNYFSDELEKNLQIFESHYNQIRKLVLNGQHGVKINGIRFETLVIGFCYQIFSRSQASQNFTIEFAKKIDDKELNPIFFKNKDQIIENKRETLSFFIPKMTEFAALNGIHNMILVELDLPIFLADDPIFQIRVAEGAIYMFPLDQSSRL